MGGVESALFSPGGEAGGPVEVVVCFSIRRIMFLSRASSSSKAMVLCVMTCSRCSKNRSWYFCLIVMVRGEHSVGMERISRYEEGRYLLGIVL